MPLHDFRPDALAYTVLHTQDHDMFQIQGTDTIADAGIEDIVITFQ